MLTQEYEYYQDPKTRALYTPDQIQMKLKEGEIDKELLSDYKLKQILHPITYTSGFIQRKPIKSGYPNKGSICYLYVSKEVKLLFRRCRYYIEK